MVYLDYAAATPVDPEVLEAMMPYYSEKFYNPSATYLAGKDVRKDLDLARSKVAEIIGAKPREIIFTAGGTEANNLAVQGILNHPSLANFNCSATVSAIEHDSVLAPANKYNCFVTLVTEQGKVDLNDLQNKITDETVLVSVMYANNEVGTIQPIKQIASIIQQERAERKQKGVELPLYLHTDACQAPNYLDLHVSRLGVDMMTLNGSKIYGPKQSGILYVASHVNLAPVIMGGGQERDMRSGTENIAQAVGFAEALKTATEIRGAESSRLEKLNRHAQSFIKKELPGVIVNGSNKHRLPNNLHITIPGCDNETTMMKLEQAGFLVAVGSACSASSEEPSHVLRAMGMSDQDAQSSLRISMGRQTSENDLNNFLKALKKII